MRLILEQGGICFIYSVRETVWSAVNFVWQGLPPPLPPLHLHHPLPGPASNIILTVFSSLETFINGSLRIKFLEPFPDPWPASNLWPFFLPSGAWKEEGQSVFGLLWVSPMASRRARWGVKGTFGPASYKALTTPGWGVTLEVALMGQFGQELPVHILSTLKVELGQNLRQELIKRTPKKRPLNGEPHTPSSTSSMRF